MGVGRGPAFHRLVCQVAAAVTLVTRLRAIFWVGGRLELPELARGYEGYFYKLKRFMVFSYVARVRAADLELKARDVE